MFNISTYNFHLKRMKTPKYSSWKIIVRYDFKHMGDYMFDPFLYEKEIKNNIDFYFLGNIFEYTGNILLTYPLYV